MCGLPWDAAIAEDSKGVQAVWPYTIESKAGLTLIRNPQLTPYLGPCFFTKNEDKASRQLNTEEKAFQSFWQQLPKWDSFDVQCLPGYNNFLPFHQQGFTHTQRLTYHIDLEQPEGSVLSSMSETRRSLIRQAERELTVETDKVPAKELYELHKETFARKGKKYPYALSYFEKVVKTCQKNKAGMMLSANDTSGNVAAMAFVVFDNERMYFLLSATNPRAGHGGAVSLLIWEAIKRAKAMGLKIFDFEGSVDAGIEKFFRSFGGSRVSYLGCTSHKSGIWKLKKALLG